MSNVELKRTHEGKIELFVAGQPALGASMTGLQIVDGSPVAYFAFPIKHVRFGEIANVVPFPIEVRGTAGGVTAR